MVLEVAIVGPGNIGTDLLLKLLSEGEGIEVSRVIGVLPVEESEGLRVAQREGIPVSTDGIDGIREHVDEFDLVFEATSAAVHERHAPLYDDLGLFAIDLTPAAVGQYVVPAVNFESVLESSTNINMITCGGQATIPIVHAVNRVSSVEYAEIVSTVASPSAGPGTRQNIDEFTRTTATGLREVGHARGAKAIIVLNPADPPIMMRNTIYTRVSAEVDIDAVRQSVADIETEMRSYVPGYEVTLDPIVRGQEDVGYDLGDSVIVTTTVEVEGAGHFLPPYAGNLDIMTNAALGAARRIAERTPPNGPIGGSASD